MNDEDDFMDWYQSNFDNNSIAFAETKEDEFEEYCLERYRKRGMDQYAED